MHPGTRPELIEAASASEAAMRNPYDGVFNGMQTGRLTSEVIGGRVDVVAPGTPPGVIAFEDLCGACLDGSGDDTLPWPTYGHRFHTICMMLSLIHI